MQSLPEWAEFCIGNPSIIPNWINSDCAPLTTVSHVAHIDLALRIVADGKIKAGLVFDESKLNKERILVVWLSPNHWVDGFRYGNVRFNYNWSTLISGKKFYWVESMAYGVAACRILITSNDYSGRLTQYIPTQHDGPWWFDASTNTHYWNSNHCLEIMIEDDLDISDCTNTDFVDHHSRFCCNNPKMCKFLGLKRPQAAASFVAALMAYQNNADALKLTECTQGATMPSSDLREAWAYIRMYLSDKIPDSCYTAGMQNCNESFVSHAILAAYARTDLNAIIQGASFFNSKQHMLESCSRFTANYFHISDWQTLAPWLW